MYNEGALNRFLETCENREDCQKSLKKLIQVIINYGVSAERIDALETLLIQGANPFSFLCEEEYVGYVSSKLNRGDGVVKTICEVIAGHCKPYYIDTSPVGASLLEQWRGADLVAGFADMDIQDVVNYLGEE